MNLPLPPALVAAFRAFLGQRVATLTDPVGAIGDVLVVGAAAPFAPTAYSRARLLRQMHASGLLRGEEHTADDRLVANADESSEVGAQRAG